MREVSCNLCGSDSRRLLVTGRDHDIPSNTRVYSLYKCEACELVYLTPRPDTPEELAEIYPTTYHSYMRTRRSLLTWMRRMAWRAEVGELIALTAPQSRILELGSATGEFLAELQRRGRSNLVGLELSAEAARVARERYGLDVRSGELSEVGLEDASVDVVVMRHVFEHLPDPRGALAEIGRVLRPGGYCVITIPNVDSHTARIFGAAWYGYDLPRHFHLFPRRSLARIFQQAGLDIEQVIHVPTPNVWIGSLRFWLAARGRRLLARFFRYQNPLAIVLGTPLGALSALLRSSGTIRVLARRPH